MASAIKAIIDHPLLSPVTEAAFAFANFVAAPWRDRWSDVKYGFTHARSTDSSFLNSVSETYAALWERSDITSFYSTVTGISALAGLIAGPVLITGGVFGAVLPTLALGAVGAVGGVLAAPFAAMVIQGALCLAGGAIMTVPCFLNGCEKAITFAFNGRTKYDAIMQARHLKKNPQAAPRTAPAPAPQPQKTAQDILLEQTESLSPDARREAIKELQKKFAQDFDAVRMEEAAKIDPRVKETVEAPAVPEMKKKPFTPGRNT